MYQVLETYQRFNQKNSMIFRPVWDPSQRHIRPQQDKTQLRNMEKGVSGLGLKDFALANASAISASSFGTGINRPNSGLTSWEMLPTHASFVFSEDKPAVTDAAAMTNQIKRVAKYLGADLVGIANLDLRWVYSHHYLPDKDENPPVEIEPHYKYVIVMAVEMDYNMMRTAPTAVHMAETLVAYSKMAYLVSAMAQFIRVLGYHAIPALNDTALSVPMAVDAGLGQLSRMGLLITSQFGPRQRLCKVITDLPLQIDKPVEIGVTEFCSVCKKCARECPGQAISMEGLTAEASCISNNPGVMKWPMMAEKCRANWANIGTNCGICIRVCPFNKAPGGIHNVVRWLVKNASWSDSLMIQMDDLAGYGKYLDPELFWKNEI